MTGIHFPVGMVVSSNREPVTVTAASGTPIILTVGTNHGFISSEYVDVNNVTGNLGANGSWQVLAVSANTITLTGSATSAPYVSGGYVTPAGWLACVGQINDWGVYVALRNLIGTTFGGSIGSTYALPNTNGKFSVGLDTAQVRVSTTYNALAATSIGATGGAATVILASGEMPDHTHGPTGLSAEIAYCGAFGLNNNGDAWPGYAKVQGLTTVMTGSTNVSGNSSAHNNLPPYGTFPDLMFGGCR